MSYKNKKLQKGKFNQLRYGFGLVKLALLKRARTIFSKRSKGETEEPKSQTEGVAPMFDPKKAIEIIRRYDRLDKNPDDSILERVVLDQVQKEGFLRFCVFVCPKFEPKSLSTSTPENYMPIGAGPDLFELRITKILSLRDGLMKAGLPMEINILIGDNDAEEYIFPFVPSLSLNLAVYRQRQTIYRRSFEARCRNIFGNGNPGYLVWSLGESRVTIEGIEPFISEENIQKELKFFDWLFSEAGPYKGGLKFSQDVLREMVKKKYALYGAQGKFLELLGGILLQTEGPGVWLERTQMLRSTGSPAIPAIYPWIRKEEKIG